MKWTVIVTVSTQRKTEDIKVEHIYTDGNARYIAEDIAIARVMMNEAINKRRFLRVDGVKVWREKE